MGEARAVLKIGQVVETPKAKWHLVADPVQTKPPSARCGRLLEPGSVVHGNIFGEGFVGCRRCLNDWWDEVLG